MVVLIDQLLRKILHKLELSGRLVKWAIELGEFGLQYKSHSTIKGQALANFIVECSFTKHANALSHPLSTTEISVRSETLIGSTQILLVWKLYVDGASNMNGSGVKIILINPKEQVLQYDIRFEFLATNNIVKYEALLLGLRLVEALKAYPFQAHSDSQLVVSQCQETSEAREPSMQRYL